MPTELTEAEPHTQPLSLPTLPVRAVAPAAGAAEDAALLRKRHRRHANPFAVRHPVTPFSPTAHFGRAAPLALDIGCGPGLFVTELARARPALNVLGIEIRAHLVAQTRAEILAAERACGHKLFAHALLANANLHLGALLPDKSVHFVAINFPDPWYKKRHHKRRVLTPEFLPVLLTKLQDGAEIHAMTDYAPLAEAMRDTLRASAQLTDMYPGPLWPPHSTTQLTSEREQTHLGRKEPIYRMAFRYRADTSHGASNPLQGPM